MKNVNHKACYHVDVSAFLMLCLHIPPGILPKGSESVTRPQVSQPYSTTGEVTILYVSKVMIMRQESRKSQTLGGNIYSILYAFHNFAKNLLLLFRRY